MQAHLASRVALTAALVCFAFLSSAFGATETGTIRGTVTLADGTPVADADVEILDLHRRVRVGADGTFLFGEVPTGRYVLVVDSLVHGNAVREVTVTAGTEIVLELGTELSVHTDTIVVSAAPSAQRRFATGSAADVVAGDELALRSEPTLGATLANQPGVNQTGFGAGSSRPIVRGLGGDRVRMLEDGVGTGDISEVSPDHAVTTETLTADRVEILRGPATLLYGSNAIGGVVNILDESIPSHLPHAALTGTVDLRLASGTEERSGAAVLRGRRERWAWTASGLVRDTGDYEIPGSPHGASAESEEEPAGHEDEHGPEPEGFLPNSDTDTEQLSLGASYFFGGKQEAGHETGFVGVSVSGFETGYGIPEGAHQHDEHDEHGAEGEAEEEDGGIRIQLERHRYDLKGSIAKPFGPFDGLKVRLGLTDYEHDEIEGNGEIGTHFENDAWEGRIELQQKERGRLSGAFGLQGGSRDFLAVGEEAFVPPSKTDSLDLFAYEELDFEPFRLQLGARWGTRDIAVADASLPDRSFDGLSGSVGLVWTAGTRAVGLSLARSVKFPAPEELYPFGPHAATRTFELGNARLGVETSLGLDAFVRHESERLRGELTVFLNDLDDYIFPAFTGEEREGFQVVEYRQQDAEFFGAELDVSVEAYESDRLHLDLRLQGDFVDAELADGSNVPRIPPLRLGTGFDLRTGPWTARAEVRWSDGQDATAENETSTPGSTVVNAAAGYRVVGSRTVWDVLLRGTNLTDEEVRLHTSYLKDLAPLPGRNLTLSLRLSF